MPPHRAVALPEAASASRVRFEIRLGTNLGPVLRGFIVPGGDWQSCARTTVIRIHSAAECDLLDVYDKLIEHDVEVTSIRLADDDADDDDADADDDDADDADDDREGDFGEPGADSVRIRPGGC